MKTKKIIISFLLLFFTLPIYSQAVYWEKIGDFNDVYDLKINSIGDIFICSGVRRSTDDGQTWELLLNSNIGNLAINDSNQIFASAEYHLNNSIYKSFDNGNTWTQCILTGGRMRSLHISKEGFVYAGNDNGVFFKSTDNGFNWSSVTVTDRQINCIGTCSNGQIFLGAATRGIFSSTDFGNSWFQINNVNGSVNSIVVNDNDHIFITNFFSILVSKDYGNSWTQIYSSNFTAGVLGIDSVGTIYAGYDDVYKSTNNGLNWINLGGPGNITTIDTYEDKIYLSTYSGVYRFDPDVLPPTFEGSDYFPLNINNRWQYLKRNNYPEGTSYGLNYVSVDDDTIIENHHYYKVEELYYSEFIRYSTQDTILYFRWSNSDSIAINFNIPNGTYYHSAYHGLVYAQAGTTNLFGLERIYGGIWVIPITTDALIYHYADSIGMNYFHYLGNYIDYTYSIIAAIVYDSSGNEIHFTDRYRPIFELDPITQINSADFNLQFKIRHHYTYVVQGNPAPWIHGLDFIDSVKMFSYYSKNDSTITLPPIIPTHDIQTANIDYAVSIQLDTTLMKNGFKFNYRFAAKDKCIIPDYSSAPDTGYYICVWDEGVGILEEENLLFEFILSQNFPNPFNPRTSLHYTVGSLQFVTLKVYDVLGNEIATLVNEEKPAGEYEVEFYGTGLPSGIYFYQLKTGSYIETKKMVLLR